LMMSNIEFFRRARRLQVCDLALILILILYRDHNSACLSLCLKMIS